MEHKLLAGLTMPNLPVWEPAGPSRFWSSRKLHVANTPNMVLLKVESYGKLYKETLAIVVSN